MAHMMTLDEVLNEWIPYRLQAIETLQFAWEWIGESEQQRQVDIVVDGRLKVSGNVALIANPMIEIGIIHARALLEFLGLGVTRDGKLKQVEKRRPDDIAVEKYTTDEIRIRIVTPSEALSAYPGPPEEAEMALVAIFEWANKGIAHLTTGVLSANYTDQHLDIACRGIRALLQDNLYAKLGREIPLPPSATPS
jgi:hypothetical protein